MRRESMACMEPFVSFLAVAAVAVLVPGPDTFVVLRTALADGPASGDVGGRGLGRRQPGVGRRVGARGGRRAGRVRSRVRSGQAGGCGLPRRPRRAGAARRRRGATPRGGGRASTRASAAAAFRRGLASDLLNVKVGLFWTALVPQFVTADSGALLPLAMVVAMGALVFAWLERVRASRGPPEPRAAAAPQRTSGQRDRGRRPGRPRRPARAGAPGVVVARVVTRHRRWRCSAP